jgi:hypothetical protein
MNEMRRNNVALRDKVGIKNNVRTIASILVCSLPKRGNNKNYVLGNYFSKEKIT